MVTLILLLLYIRNFCAVVALGGCLLALARINHWLGNRGTRRLKQFIWGVSGFHGVTMLVTAGQVTQILPVNQNLAVTLFYTVAHIFMAATTLVFSLYVLGVINGDPTDPNSPAHRLGSHPLRRKDDLVVPQS